jgi:hypothetical protein
MSERITLEEARAPGYPVVKRTALGQTFRGAIIKSESRDRLKRGDDGTMKPIVKDNGKHAQEMVVTCLTLPGTNSPAGLGEDESVPEPGDVVRLILKGKAFGDWIESKRNLPGGTVAVGDVVSQTTTMAQVYDANGNATGAEIRDQGAVDAARVKGRSVGIYGPLTLELPTEDSWTTKAIAAYRASQDRPPAEAAPAEDPWGAAPAASTNGVVKPASITDVAWNGMDDTTKRAVAASLGEPPF